MARPIVKASVLGGRAKKEKPDVPVVGDSPEFEIPETGTEKYVSNPVPDLPSRESSYEERANESPFEMPESPFESQLDSSLFGGKIRAPMLANQESVRDLSGEGNSKKLKGPQDFDDIFAYGQYLMQQGILVSYHIRKNGTVVAGKEDCSLDWEKLQKKYGGGQYQITMKNQRKGTWITRVSEEISEPAEPVQTPQQIQQQQQAQQQQQQAQQNNPAEAIQAAGSIMSTLLQSTKESNNQLTSLIGQLLHKQVQQQPQNQSNGLAEIAPVLAAVMNTLGNRDNGLPQMMAEMTKSQQMMMLEMSKLQMTAQERQQEAVRESSRVMQAALDKMNQNTMEMIRELRHEMSNSSSGKKGDMSPTELISLVLQSRDTGFQTARALHKEMEDRAKDLAETMHGRETPAAPAEERSSTDRLIEMLVPVFGAVVQSKIASSQAAPQLPPAQPQYRPMPPQQRLPPPPQYRPMPQQQQQARPPMPAPRPAPVPAPRPTSLQGAIPTRPVPSSRPVPVTVAPPPQARPVARPAPAPAPARPAVPQVDEQYLEAHLPMLGEVLTATAATGTDDPAVFAAGIANALAQRGESVAEFCTRAPVSAILEKMTQLGVTDIQYLTQVREIYEQLERYTESTTNQT